MLTLGETIKTYREENGLSMQEFADRCGLSKGYISMLEKGKHPQSERSLVPSIKTLACLAKGMNIDVETLTSNLDMNTIIRINDISEDLPWELPDELQTLKNNWDSISHDDKAIIKIIADKYRKEQV